MLDRIKCLLFGHKKYSPNALNGESIIEVKDYLHSTLVTINVCERCGEVYSNLRKDPPFVIKKDKK
jgi:hypothetical protein